MNKIRVLIGIGFFLITATVLIGNNQKCTNLSNTSTKDGISSIVLSPKTAATTNYELDFNFTWGGSEEDKGQGIALDDSGNIYITGHTLNMTSPYHSDAFVAKYDSTGKSLLNITWDGSNNDYGSDIALDDSGNIYITGNTWNISTSSRDAFVAKFNSTTGKSLLNITWGGSDTDYGSDIALDDLGNIYITGVTDSFGAGNNDAFVAKFNSTTKECLFNITWGGSSSDEATSIALDGLGNVYITGRTLSFGAGNDDAFVAKFNSTTGKYLLNITWGGSSSDEATSIILDGLGNIYITGATYSFGAVSGDAFVAKFNSNTKELLLNITWGGSDIDSGSDIVLDTSGNVYITGVTASFGAGSNDAFVAKFDNTFKSLLNITWGGSKPDYGYGIALDSSGNIHITGANYSFSAGYTDAFIIKYSVVHEYFPPSDDDDDDDEDKRSPIIISGYNLIFLVGFLGLCVVLLVKKCLK